MARYERVIEDVVLAEVFLEGDIVVVGNKVIEQEESDCWYSKLLDR